MQSSKRKMRCYFFLMAGMLLWIALPRALAEDVLQWRNNRDGIYKESGLLKSWPEAGPKLLWNIDDVGDGYSSPIIVKEKIYLTGAKDGSEFVSCLDIQGKRLWRTEYASAWKLTYPGARTTPTFADGRLFAVSADGVAACVDSESGKLIWKVNAWEKYQGKSGRWGIAESPLVVDGKMICTPTGELTTMIALNAADGALAWKSPSLNDTGAYVSPALLEYNSKKQIIGVAGKFIFGVDPQNGQIIWSFDFLETSVDNNADSGAWRTNCNTPVCKNDMIFVTGGNNHCGVLLQLNKDATGVNLLWKSGLLDNHHGHVVLVDGYLYGSNWISNSSGNWVCLDWKTGKKMYEKEWQTKGSIIYDDGMLYCYEEKHGNLALVKATPDGFNVISSFIIELGSEMHWAHPVISGGLLYIRHGNALIAYDIRAAKSSK
ncbi:MAG: PQQ-like beta-propeller repeat protein [Candidatus Riflebacteria bacterium]|nr:PQQ-like beta-propeller repeat protein [Candidatus Riflebacteria bacterium]